MQIKTSELQRAALDWAVAIAKGIPVEEIYISGRGEFQRIFRRLKDEDGNLDGTFMTGPDLLFCSKWESGGPIIEREKIQLSVEAVGVWSAFIEGCTKDFLYHGPTPLIAAMRCFVASKLGDTVEIPEELK